MELAREEEEEEDDRRRLSRPKILVSNIYTYTYISSSRSGGFSVTFSVGTVVENRGAGSCAVHGLNSFLLTGARVRAFSRLERS